MESFPESPRTLTALGRLHEWLDETEMARSSYERGLELLRASGGPFWQELQLRERISSMGEATSRPATLVVEQGEQREHVSGEVCVLGRGGRTADIVVPDGTIAHQHCVIWRQDGVWWLEDLGSTNGTSVNGEPITEAVELERESTLRLADEVVIVRILDE